MIPLLTREEVQIPRTQEDLAQWVDATIEKFGATIEGRKAWRLKQVSYVKQLSEEMLPLRWYADAFYNGNNDVLFKVVLGNQSYDAIVQDITGNVICYLQITLAFDGKQSHLKQIHMTEYGHSPVTGVVLVKDENGKVPETNPECVDTDEQISAEFQKILETFKKKANMRYERNTRLIVSFRSDGIIDVDYMQRLDAFIQNKILLIENKFQELIFVSGTPAHYLRYKVNPT